MNPIELSDNLKSTLQSYLTTIFNVNRDGSQPDLAAKINESFEIDGALAMGPYLEITSPYRTGKSIDQLVDDGILSPLLRDLPEHNLPLSLDVPLYQHQDDAIRKLLDVDQKRNIVVSSGTGSGKTECFLIPILNDLLIDPAPGVRALLIYPLNALVNDQLERLRKLLAGTQITFGRYTSELEYTVKKGREKNPKSPSNEILSREEIQDRRRIPQILITNYAMLEYLLLRPEDSPLFESGAWRFIVLDEAHTYSGAQGIEVSMLLRRLKHRLEKRRGDVQCIATSATLTEDNASAAAAFAHDLFDETFDESDIMFGQPDHDHARPDEPYEVDANVYLDSRFEGLIQSTRLEQSVATAAVAEHMAALGLGPSSEEQQDKVATYANNPRGFVYEMMRNNDDLIKLREQLLEKAPRTLADIADDFFASRLSDGADRRKALYRLVELSALARPDQDKAPLLPARYHMFMRSPQGIWLCLNPDCSGRQSPHGAAWSKVFSIRRETCDSCSCKVFPISVCRDCGQVFVKTVYMDGRYYGEVSAKENELLPEHDTRYFVWPTFEENRALGEDQEEELDEDTDDQSERAFSYEGIELCVRCGVRISGNHCPCANAAGKPPAQTTLQLVLKDNGKKGRAKYEPYLSIEECPRCRPPRRGHTETATAVTVGGSVPLSILTYELYRHAPESHEEEICEKPGNGRKVLSFTDNRQGAARFASYLETTVKMQNYQHIVPDTIREFKRLRGVAPSFSLLTKAVRDKAWQLGIFHNDADLTSFWRKYTRLRTPDEQQQIELDDKIQTQLLAGFTTGRSSRNSLESLGLVAVRYKGLEDIDSLAAQLRLDSPTTRTLLAYLLDRIRWLKVVSFPYGVDPADSSFGWKDWHPSLIKNGKTHRNQEEWIGKTESHSRRRYMQQVLQKYDLPHHDEEVIDKLIRIFDWLRDPENRVMTGSSTEGYQIDYSHLVFETADQWYRCTSCQRLYAHGPQLPCPHIRCKGTLEPVDIEKRQEDNYFYRSFEREVVPLRVEEHTAQLTPEKGRDYQDKFKYGDINVLSCSTTFEMGIDLGDLQAVVMSNVPPTVANYRQRSGRAGRRAGGAAFILTWTSDRPHDQSYFRNPEKMISGRVRVPYVAVDNPHIQRRHINAILLSAFLRYRKAALGDGWTARQEVGMFFDHRYVDDPHVDHLEDWLASNEQHIGSLLSRFAESVETPDISLWIAHFLTEMRKAFKTYSAMANYYNEQFNIFYEKSRDDFRRYEREAAEYDGLRTRLREERLIDYLCSRGVLPSYSFPIYAVEFRLPSSLPGSKQLRLQRDLKLAIREYAPGAEVVADKRIWRSDGVQFHKDIVRYNEYRICETCNHLQHSEIPTKPLPDVCPICGAPPSPRQRRAPRFVIPDGFFANRQKNGRPAGPYVQRAPNLMKSALLLSNVTEPVQITPKVTCAYDRTGNLFYVNEGHKRSRVPGFYVQLEGEGRGELVKAQKDRRRMTPVSLGHQQMTDTLHLTFEDAPASPGRLPFWLSLMYALIHGASHALQIERTDIDGVLFPRKGNVQGEWRQTIVLYDDVPGGAGHVQQIRNEFSEVVQEACRIADCTDCAPETSCYSCLRDYNNQVFHHILRRGEIVSYLQNLRGLLVSQESSR